MASERVGSKSTRSRWTGLKPWVTLVGSLVALFSGAAALVLFRVRGDLGKSVGGPRELFETALSVTGYGAVVMMVGALLGLVAVSLLALLRGVPVGNEARPAPPTNVAAAPASRIEVSRPPENGSWIKLVEGCVDVVDELDEHSDGFDTSRRELASHVVLRLEEVLERSGVEIITGEPTFDRARHKPVGTGAAASPGTTISETLSPGFAVGPRVLRRAKVRLLQG